jgi:hypothetical protein
VDRKAPTHAGEFVSRITEAGRGWAGSRLLAGSVAAIPDTLAAATDKRCAASATDAGGTTTTINHGPELRRGTCGSRSTLRIFLEEMGVDPYD